MTNLDSISRQDFISPNRTQQWPPRTSPDQTKREAVPGNVGSQEQPAALVVESQETVGNSLCLDADRLLLRLAEGGAVRVGHSRISLDLVVEQYENGMTPEEMVRAYDTLDLADIHAVIAYYLRHRDEVQAYLSRRKEEAEALRAKIEAERPRVTREELLARRAAREKADAPNGQ
jgi:uncharacterized protein (DUF433 family)